MIIYDVCFQRGRCICFWEEIVSEWPLPRCDPLKEHILEHSDILKSVWNRNIVPIRNHVMNGILRILLFLNCYCIQWACSWLHGSHCPDSVSCRTNSFRTLSFQKILIRNKSVPNFGSSKPIERRVLEIRVLWSFARFLIIQVLANQSWLNFIHSRLLNLLTFRSGMWLWIYEHDCPSPMKKLKHFQILNENWNDVMNIQSRWYYQFECRNVHEPCNMVNVKDIRLNKETYDLRKMKPKRETQKDKADYLLECEKKVT